MSFGNNHSYSIIVLRAAVPLDASHQHSYLLELLCSQLSNHCGEVCLFDINNPYLFGHYDVTIMLMRVPVE